MQNHWHTPTGTLLLFVDNFSRDGKTKVVILFPTENAAKAGSSADSSTPADPASK